MLSLPLAAITGILLLLLGLAAFAAKAAHDGADKGVYHLLWYVLALITGVVLVLLTRIA